MTKNSKKAVTQPKPQTYLQRITADTVVTDLANKQLQNDEARIATETAILQARKDLLSKRNELEKKKSAFPFDPKGIIIAADQVQLAERDIISLQLLKDTLFP